MSKATKLGYGFLCLGASVPYLIEHLCGAPVALVVTLSFAVLGTALLYFGQIHRDEGEKPVSRMTKMATGLLLLAICIVVCLLGWRVLRVKNARAVETPPPPAVPGQTIIQQQSQDDTCSNIVGGRDVKVKCAEKDNGKAKR
jgi:hypothetical protein